MKSVISPQTDLALASVVALVSAYWLASQGDGNSFGFLVGALILTTHFVKNLPLAILAGVAGAFLFRLVQGVHEGLENQGKKKKKKTKDNFTDMLGAANDGNLEKLMQRQTVLMSQLKDMAPLMQSAKEALRQLPAGYLDKALKSLKTNMKTTDI